MSAAVDGDRAEVIRKLHELRCRFCYSTRRGGRTVCSSTTLSGMNVRGRFDDLERPRQFLGCWIYHVSPFGHVVINSWMICAARSMYGTSP